MGDEEFFLIYNKELKKESQFLIDKRHLVQICLCLKCRFQFNYAPLASYRFTSPL